MNTTRRQVLKSAGIFGALFLTRSLVACALPDASEDVETSNDALVTCGDAVIGRNHGHALRVSAADVAAGVEKTYAIKGTSSHDHQVTVTAAAFAKLATGGSVTLASSTTVGHSHDVTVTCAASSSPDAGADADAAPAVCPGGATAVAISANHGHSLVVPTRDVVAGVGKSYSIKGAAGHVHTVAVSAAQFAELAAGATITTKSSTDAGHSHVVKVICA